ncbi:MAG: MucR family transcriptional regulator [Henriciella sp.]|nr:MucR family transcriptional regulator [Henriciella sp.]
MTNSANDSVSNLDLLTQASDIVAAYVSNNAISPADLPGLLKVVHAKLGELADEGTQTVRPEPAVPIKKSVTDHHIICLEDGAKLKMLKRYLRTHFDMSPDEYRARWGLPADYPMVAPEYARRRSDFAKKIGLGKKGR